MPSDDRPSRGGRPRLVPDTAPDRSAREQILDVAAALFAENRFAAASTRVIAERVGVRHASLYDHVAGKGDVPAELLTTSARPSLDVVRGIERPVPTAAGALCALATTVAAARDEADALLAATPV